MSRRKSVAITRQLDGLRSGRLPLDDCAPDTLALLPVIAGIELDASFGLAVSSLEAGRNQLLAAIANLPQQQPLLALPGWMRTPALAGGLAAALSGGAIAYAAQGATPDSPLYPVQQAVQAVQAVSQSVPLLQLPTPTATPSPTATAMPASAGLPVSKSSSSRARTQVVQPTPTERARTQPAAIPQDRGSDRGPGDNRGKGGDEGQASQAVPTASAPSGLRSGRQDDVHPSATSIEGRGLKGGEFRSASDSGGNGNGNEGDNDNGRAGDRPARSGRGS